MSAAFFGLDTLAAFVANLQEVYGSDATIKIDHRQIFTVRGRGIYGVYSFSDVSKSAEQLRAESMKDYKMQ